MKKIKLFITITMLAVGLTVKAQDIPANINAVISKDDTTALAKVINPQNINDCYGHYSLLSQTIRANAIKCFQMLIARGADVNKICDNYVPPLMHAVKYNRQEMAKLLVAKGAEVNYKYEGDDVPNGPAKGETPLSYAGKYKRDDIAAFLKPLTKQP